MRIRIIKINEAGIRKFEEFSGTSFTIGRSKSEIILNGSNISRQHALIYTGSQESQLFIKDLGSVNGTQVNGKRIEATQIKVGDTIKIGNSIIRILEVSIETSTSIASTNAPSLSEFIPNNWEHNFLCVPKEEQAKFNDYLNRDTQGE
jgi:pSer/pThr/pTyr-binding forkhead associated (FHA) protein